MPPHPSDLLAGASHSPVVLVRAGSAAEWQTVDNGGHERSLDVRQTRRSVGLQPLTSHGRDGYSGVRAPPPPSTCTTSGLQDWCCASIWSASDGSAPLALGASSDAPEPEEACRIVWMISHDAMNPAEHLTAAAAQLRR